MNRISPVFSVCRGRGEKTLALFLTAGFPHRESTPDIALGLARAGADIIELGMPFSDPLADGPVIQQSSAVAIKNGVTLKHILGDVRTIRGKSDVPIILMGYLNPLMSYGVENFLEDAASAGVDGMILPELPLEESGRYKEPIERNNLANILLVTPTTPTARMIAIDAASSGFLYCVSTTGVTGAKGREASDDYIARVRSIAKKNPVLVGFGISTPEDARRASAHADGVIIGSALIKRLQEGESLEVLAAWVKSLKEALTS